MLAGGRRPKIPGRGCEICRPACRGHPRRRPGGALRAPAFDCRFGHLGGPLEQKESRSAFVSVMYLGGLTVAGLPRWPELFKPPSQRLVPCFELLVIGEPSVRVNGGLLNRCGKVVLKKVHHVQQESFIYYILVATQENRVITGQSVNSVLGNLKKMGFIMEGEVERPMRKHELDNFKQGVSDVVSPGSVIDVAKDTRSSRQRKESFHAFRVWCING